MIKRKDIIFNKNSNGFSDIKIGLPIDWIRKMGFSEDDKRAILEFNDNTNTITIKKDFEKDEGVIFLEEAINILKRLELKETHGNTRRSLRGRLNGLLTKCYNLGISIDFLAVDFPIIREINVYKTTDNTASVVVIFEKNYTFKK